MSGKIELNEQAQKRAQEIKEYEDKRKLFAFMNALGEMMEEHGIIFNDGGNCEFPITFDSEYHEANADNWIPCGDTFTRKVRI